MNMALHRSRSIQNLAPEDDGLGVCLISQGFLKLENYNKYEEQNVVEPSSMVAAFER